MFKIFRVLGSYMYEGNPLGIQAQNFRIIMYVDSPLGFRP